ncbi:MAG: hypothetical protein ACRC5R_01830 [Mycoplasmatales bacterium]
MKRIRIIIVVSLFMFTSIQIDANAVNYSRSKLGYPYNWKFSELGGGFYCSELVKFAWLSTGHVVNAGGGRNAITPMSIANSSNTIKIEGNLWLKILNM